MSDYLDNYGEREERDIMESQAYELELAAEEREHEEQVASDRMDSHE
jgi:hypothetical protein